MDTLTLNDRVAQAQSNLVERNDLIDEFKPFIANTAQACVGRYLRYGEDEELSISLMAFNEAITSYEESKGSFLSFAKAVISRRLTDYGRAQRRHLGTVALEYTADNDDEEMTITLADKLSIREHTQVEQQNDLRYEVEHFSKELAKWGLTLTELTKVSPSQKPLREDARSIIRYILSSEDARMYIEQKQKLPLNLIEKALKISRKKLDRLRKYLIAMYIVATGNYEGIQEFLRL